MKKLSFLNPSRWKDIYRTLPHAQSGAAVIEFAILAPVLMLFTFGLLEFALVMGNYLRANEAMRAAARVAAIQPAIADLSGLDDVPAICTGDGGVSCSGFTLDNAGSYAAILAEAQRVLPNITASQLSVTYSSSGVGVSTTANGTSPMVTVQLSDYEHNLIVGNLIPGLSVITFPDFATSRLIAY